MQLAVVVNASAEVKPDQTTGMLIHSMLVRGHRVSVGGVDGLEVDDSERVFLRATDLTEPASTVAASLEPLRMGPHQRVDLLSCSGVLIRTNPGRDTRPAAHRTALDLLRLVRDAGPAVLNDPDGLARAGSKLYLNHLPPDVRPRTLVSHDRAALEAFVREAPGPVVLKPLLGSRGEDVFKLQPGDENIRQIAAFLTRHSYAMAQDHLPEAVEGDTRVILMDGEILVAGGRAAAVRRVPPALDFRSNVFQGGHAQPAIITPAMARITGIIGPRLRQDGLFLTGMDLIGDRIVELNVFSPGGMADANTFEGVDFITPIVEGIERRVAGSGA